MCVCVSNLPQGQVKLEKALALYLIYCGCTFMTSHWGRANLCFCSSAETLPPSSFTALPFAFSRSVREAPYICNGTITMSSLSYYSAQKSPPKLHTNTTANIITSSLSSHFPSFLPGTHGDKQKKKQSILNTKCT